MDDPNDDQGTDPVPLEEEPGEAGPADPEPDEGELGDEP